MPGEVDDLDEPDHRQPVIDVDVAIELSQLSGVVKSIAQSVDGVERGLDQISRALDELAQGMRFETRQLGVYLFFIIVSIIVGIVAILGTLRHWF